ncbi:adenine specific DNA methyltransferase (plasmid) [Borreliella spielmanii A14S]|uniref:Adenine specific DNA methyltransferase n=1 Tax=Borreliella spielmanii A14S TaxID=498742 RepID=C0RBT8_9SPIR|nr:adenine specific DNA methyltransferase [Borreliella spielmanii A14S]
MHLYILHTYRAKFYKLLKIDYLKIIFVKKAFKRLGKPETRINLCLFIRYITMRHNIVVYTRNKNQKVNCRKKIL